MDVFFIYYMTEYSTNYYYIINNTDIIGSSDSLCAWRYDLGY